MSQIHPTSVIEPGAQIADSAEIGPFCHVGPHAAIGPKTRLVSHVSVLGQTTLGTGNTVWPQATIGADPQDLKYDGEDSSLVIGNHNTIRECATIHLGTKNGGGVTRIGDDNLIMVGAHLAHDCVVGNHVIIANGVHLAGHIVINDHVVLSGASAVHHYVTLGQYAFIGGMTRIVHDAPPFMIIEGNPATVRGVNIVGLRRHQFPEQAIDHLKDAYRRLYRKSGNGSSAGTMTQNMAGLEVDYPDDECITLLTQFIQRSSIGTFGRFRETHRTDKRQASAAR